MPVSHQPILFSMVIALVQLSAAKADETKRDSATSASWLERGQLRLGRRHDEQYPVAAQKRRA
jgi:hypothetical protein